MVITRYVLRSGTISMRILSTNSGIWLTRIMAPTYLLRASAIIGIWRKLMWLVGSSKRIIGVSYCYWLLVSVIGVSSYWCQVPFFIGVIGVRYLFHCFGLPRNRVVKSRSNLSTIRSTHFAAPNGVPLLTDWRIRIRVPASSFSFSHSI
ncbi:MAG: hypothetical protein UV01_C0019G0004 [Parcubacteria group bacterium GW2011_GWA2_42_14]|nr:MAG: hypothetical protein UV01_C0019G0004 [Parcubacteria group bacterium GW2011_GWA2_42_14]